MNTSRNLLIAAAAAVSFAAVASSANAQASANGTGSASVQILKALSVTSSATSLPFGKVAISASTPGTVAISEAGARSQTGGVSLVGSNSVTPATFAFNGEAGAAVTVSYSDSSGAANAGGTYSLTGTGGNVTLTVTSTKVGSQTLDASGNLTVPVSGSVAIPAAQAGGAYTGSFYVNVAYN